MRKNPRACLSANSRKAQAPEWLDFTKIPTNCLIGAGHRRHGLADRCAGQTPAGRVIISDEATPRAAMAVHQVNPQNSKVSALDPIWDRIRTEAEDIVRR